MENCPYPSYPDSGNSSPRSREMEFDNQPWDEQHQQHYKAKFMCSYGGKILPRPHDNQFSYVGGETKILSVDRNIKFHSLIAKLVALCGESDIAFRYQLPGEDLDALISVTNDDDLDHLMQEYDRLHRSSTKPARMRLFIFPASANNTGSSGLGRAVGADRDRFVEALDTVPAPDLPKPMPGKVDFLFELEKRVSPPPPPPPVVPDPVVAAASVGEVGLLGRDDREFVSDHGVSPAEIQRQLQELQRLQISGHGPEDMYRRKSEEAVIGGFGGGGAPSGYWPDKQIHGGAFTGAVMTGPPNPPEQPLYVIPGHGGLYQAPQMFRPVAGQPGHGYYAVQQQRAGTDAYRDQPFFNVAPPLPTQQQPQPQPQPLSMAAPPTLPPQQQIQKMAGTMSSEGIVAGWPSSGAADHVAYAPAGYDGATGRQVFYTAAGGMVAAAPPPPPPQFQGSAAETADMRPRGQVLGQDGKVIGKVSRASV